jgi:ACR3 family arsenite transporter
MNAQLDHDQKLHPELAQNGNAQMHSDEEKQCTSPPTEVKNSVYAGLGWLDRLLALWILLAIIIGILLGNFVDSVGPALQRGKFVDVSVPIGE